MSEWSSWIDSLRALITDERLVMALRAAAVLVIGLALATIVGRRLGAVAEHRLDRQAGMIAKRAGFYGTATLTVLWVMGELNFSLSVILGTAGVLSVAIGFASQTSASNLISGLFLIGERAFVVGDVIKIGDTSGEVLSIDWLSVKLRTFDNLFVRLPNETMLKAQVTNLTRFPIRRLDLQLGVAYKEQIEAVRSLLLEIADKNPLCLEEPPPLIIFQGFGDSAVNLQFSVWSTKENFLRLRNTITEEIKTRFDAAGVEIPFPHRSLYAGSVTEPFPIRIVAEGGAASGQRRD
ncbi:MAG: mechanosensitive ion channel family protein [Acidobacteriota bacterium]|nr:mechanosensitive ion channel family protein [Acidobacteriota bacterium]